ncbi:MAG: DUF5688 family protein [Eubacterium sp.]|nr:DUF5688 family protein [Eubacterium sp.]
MNTAIIAKTDEVNSILAEHGSDIRLVIQKNSNKDVCRQGIIVQNGMAKQNPVIYPSMDFLTGNAEEIAKQVQDFYDTHAITINVKPLLEAGHIRSAIRPRLLSIDNRSDLQNRNLALTEYVGGLVIAFYLPTGDNGYLQITNAILEQAGMSVEQALACAVQNIEPDITFQPLSEKLGELSEMDPSLYTSPLWILSTSDSYNGAAAILSDPWRKKISTQLGGDFFVLPSSRHEMLVFRDDGWTDAAMLYNMVSEINLSLLQAEDFLIDQVFYYSVKTGLQGLF